MTLFVDRRTRGIVRRLSRRWPPNTFVVVEGESLGRTKGQIFVLRGVLIPSIYRPLEECSEAV